MAAQVRHPVTPVTQDTHPFTYNCQFVVPQEERPGLVTLDGFRNLLEAHIGTLNKAKQVSYTRNAAWLRAIRDKNTTPPKGYAGNRASWKNEIGATNPATSKWVVENGQVYKKDKKAENGREIQPMTPTESLYDLMTLIHHYEGHKGRDNFFILIKKESGSVKKAFCHQFVQICCDKAESWQGGDVPYGWQAPVRHRDAGEDNHIAVDDNTNVAANIILPAFPPQSMQQDNQQLGDMFMNFGDIDFNVLDTQMAAANWNMDLQSIFHNHPTPPGTQGLGPEQGPMSHLSAPSTPPTRQVLIGAQYAAVNPQDFGDFQNPLLAQNSAAETSPYAVAFMNNMQNNPEFFHNEQYFVQMSMPMPMLMPMQMQMQAPQQMGGYNYEPSFAGQAAQEPVHYPQVGEQDQAIFDYNMMAPQNNYPLANNDMVFNNNNNQIARHTQHTNTPQSCSLYCRAPQESCQDDQ